MRCACGDERGVVLFIALLVMVALSLAGIALLSLGRHRNHRLPAI
jgi:Tfp pilus assembly protein PilX